MDSDLGLKNLRKLLTSLDVCRKYLHPLVRRRVLARIFSTLLCAIAVTVRPFSKFGGASAFLCLTLKELVFAVNETLPQQIEATILNISGAFLGIGISTLARYLSCLRPDNSTTSRSIPAIFLVLVAFVAGLVKSTLPRLTASARISCFLAIFILTNKPGVADGALEVSLNFTWVALTSAIICFSSSLIFLPWFSTPFAGEVATSFAHLHAALDQRIGSASCENYPEISTQPRAVFGPVPASTTEILLKCSIQLNTAYAQAAFELRIGRLSVKSLKPLIVIVEHLRRELAWGHAVHRSGYHEEEETVVALHPVAVELGRAVIEAMEVVERCIRSTYKHSLGHSPPLADEEQAVQRAKKNLLQARDRARDQLKNAFDNMSRGEKVPRSDVPQICQSPRDRSDYCLFVVSLLQMAHEMRQALQIAHGLLGLWDTSHTRLWTPRFSWQWLGIAPHQIITEESVEPLSEPIPHAPVRRMSVTEAQQGIREQREHRRNIVDGEDGRQLFRSRLTKRPLGYRARSFSAHRVWNSEFILRCRTTVAPIVHSVMHSKHLQHAFKNALGVGLLSMPIFFPANSPARLRWEEFRGQWMVITYVWVLETNTGATWRVAYLRLSGTLLGAIYAYLTWLICHTNPYGIVASLTVADMPASYIITQTRISSIGVVASVTLPPIAFAQYTNSNSGTPIFTLAVWRAAMISAGIVAALMVNTFMWPRHCRVLFLRSTSQTLALLSQLYLMLGRDLFLRSQAHFPYDRKKILELELHIRNTLARLSYLVVTMNDEVSLMPKPLAEYRKIVVVLQAVLDTMTGLRKIRENIPVKEAIASVHEERREFVSTICLRLYAGEHAFRARQALPQFLPSGSAARIKLVQAIEASIRSHPHQVPGLSIVYIFAESEMLRGLVEALDSVLNICRVLFGTATWLHEDIRFQATIGDGEQVHGGWYGV